MWARVGSAISTSQRAWEAGVVANGNGNGNADDYLYDTMENEDDFVVFPDDNASHRCSASYYETCSTACDDNNSDESCSSSSTILILLKMLRWIKLIVLKLARSYYALPILLVALPLMMGLLLGFYCGRRYEVQQQQNRIRKQQPKNGGSYSISSVFSVVAFMLLSFFAPGGPDTNTDTDMEVLRKGNPPRPSENPSSGPAVTSTATNTNATATSKKQHPQESQQDFPAAATTANKEMDEREQTVRSALRSDDEAVCESGVDVAQVPRHVAVIMDGNRRYGRSVYGKDKAAAGHWDGSRKVLEFAKWCIAEHVQVLTVYAFSTENWKRDPVEVATLMALFVQYCEELRVESIRRNIRVRVLSTETTLIPSAVKNGLYRLEEDTKHCTGGLQMNVCLSYGSRGEIINACRDIARDCVNQDEEFNVDQISEETFEQRLLTKHCGDVDVLIRTSGEIRISNYLLWQLAYAEMFFVSKNWPELEKSDLLEVIRSYANGRHRRFGK
jgi:undecaprenyl diphosphate synthase